MQVTEWSQNSCITVACKSQQSHASHMANSQGISLLLRGHSQGPLCTPSHLSRLWAWILGRCMSLSCVLYSALSRCYCDPLPGRQTGRELLNSPLHFLWLHFIFQVSLVISSFRAARLPGQCPGSAVWKMGSGDDVTSSCDAWLQSRLLRSAYLSEQRTVDSLLNKQAKQKTINKQTINNKQANKNTKQAKE